MYCCPDMHVSPVRGACLFCQLQATVPLAWVMYLQQDLPEGADEVMLTLLPGEEDDKFSLTFYYVLDTAYREFNTWRRLPPCSAASLEKVTGVPLHE